MLRSDGFHLTMYGPNDSLRDVIQKFIEQVQRSPEQMPTQAVFFYGPEALLDDFVYVSPTRSLEFAAALAGALKNEPGFPQDVVIQLHSGNALTGFYPNFLGDPVHRVALKTKNPDATIAWLRRVLATESSAGQYNLAVWGAPVHDVIQLTDDVQLVPFESMPEDARKFGLKNAGLWAARLPQYNPLLFMPPSSVLVCSRTMSPAVVSLRNEEQSADVPNPFLEVHEYLHAIALILTAVGPRSLTTATMWFEYSDIDMRQAAILGGAHTKFTEIIPMTLADYPAIDPVVAKAAISGFFSLNDSAKAQVKVALKRLNQAQVRHDIGDRAIEVAIALESLLGNGNTELTHRVSMRGAKLLGGTVEERMRTFDVIKAAYGIRSSMVHTGSGTQEKHRICGTRTHANEIIPLAISVCAKVVLKLLSNRAIPEWNRFDVEAT